MPTQLQTQDTVEQFFLKNCFSKKVDFKPREVKQSQAKPKQMEPHHTKPIQHFYRNSSCFCFCQKAVFKIFLCNLER